MRPSKTCLSANPHIFNHNLETVRRLTPSVRHRATYDRSLSVLKKVKQKRGDTIYTKSGMMLGLGEREEEVMVAMQDLRRAGCDILTLGQYLQPSLKHLPVVEFVSPEQFAAYATWRGEMGFIHVASGPMVRSSYHADEFSMRRAKAEAEFRLSDKRFVQQVPALLCKWIAMDEQVNREADAQNSNRKTDDGDDVFMVPRLFGKAVRSAFFRRP